MSHIKERRANATGKNKLP